MDRRRCIIVVTVDIKEVPSDLNVMFVDNFSRSNYQIVRSICLINVVDARIAKIISFQKIQFDE